MMFACSRTPLEQERKSPKTMRTYWKQGLTTDNKYVGVSTLILLRKHHNETHVRVTAAAAAAAAIEFTDANVTRTEGGK